MGEPLTLLALVTVGGLALARAIQSNKSRERRLDVVWERAATRLAGEVSTTAGPMFGPATRRIHLTVDGTPISIAAVMEGGGRNSREMTKCQAILSGLEEVDMQVGPRSALDSITRMFTARETPTGDTWFDERFRATGRPEPLVRALLDAKLRNRIRSVGEEVTISGRTLLIERRGHPNDASAIIEMARYAEAFVDRWNDLAREPARIAQKLGLVATEPIATLFEGKAVVIARGLRRGREVTMSLVLGPRGIFTTLGFDAAGDDFSVERGDEDEDEVRVEGSVDERARSLFADASDLVRVEQKNGHVTIALEGLSPSTRDAALVLEAILGVAGSAGVYR